MADAVAEGAAGAFKGNITADRVELLEGGRLWGILDVRSFLLDEGAHFYGQLKMQGSEESDALLMPRPSAGETIVVESPPEEPAPE